MAVNELEEWVEHVYYCFSKRFDSRSNFNFVELFSAKSMNSNYSPSASDVSANATTSMKLSRHIVIVFCLFSSFQRSILEIDFHLSEFFNVKNAWKSEWKGKLLEWQFQVCWRFRRFFSRALFCDNPMSSHPHQTDKLQQYEPNLLKTTNGVRPFKKLILSFLFAPITAINRWNVYSTNVPIIVAATPSPSVHVIATELTNFRSYF